METKICKQCKKEKNITEFRLNKKYYSNICRECEKENSYKYYLNHKEERKKYTENHKQEAKEYQKEYGKTHKENHNIANKKYREKNKEKIKITAKKYRDTHKKERNEKRKLKKEKNKCYKLKEQTRNMIYKSFDRKGLGKSKKTEEIIGISHKEFYEYLLNTFKNNYGYEWDGKEKVSIDHIIPLAIANTEEEIIKLCHYKNLQLLKLKDNLEKSDKLNWKIKKGDKND